MEHVKRRGLPARSDQVPVGPPRKEPPVPFFPDVPPGLYNGPPPGQHGVDLAGNGLALVGRVVDAHVVRCGGDRLGRRRVVEDDIGIRPRRQQPLPRVQPEHPGGRS